MGILDKVKKPKKEEESVDVVSSGGVVSENKIMGSRTKKFNMLIKQAWLTERAGDVCALGKYIFIISSKANKPEIKKAIEQTYKVKVRNVNIINIKSKPRRMGRNLGRTSNYKKAIITLRKGEKMDIMPT